MSQSRRTFLRQTLGTTAAVGALPLLQACGSEDGAAAQSKVVPTYSYDGALGPDTLFAHGVASGDPLVDSVVLWTRVSLPEAELAAGEVEVFWEIARDAAFEDRVDAGTVVAKASADWTVKVDPFSLVAGTTYYYRFWLQGRSSPIGRTRTLPETKVEHLRIGVCSCSNFSGYFTAYRHMAERADLDVVLHLGDYIYEYAGNPENARFAAPAHEIVTLEDYRTRYAAHRSDPDLQEVHRQHAFINIWDDHETANNAYTDGSPQHDEGEGTWGERKSVAQQAWREWMPARVGDDGKIWRSFEFGQLCDLWMLDTRLWNRDKQTTPSQKAVIADPSRSFLGPDQEAWLHDGLRTSKARWRVLGQQVMIARLGIGSMILNSDQWDGYQPTRDRLFEVVRETGVGNFVVLTGDIHTSWANDLVEDSSPEAGKYDVSTGTGALGVEFVVPGITSGGLPGGAGAEIAGLALEYNPHIKWSDVQHRGYGVLDLTSERCAFEWTHVEAVSSPGGKVFHGKSFVTMHGSGHLDPMDGPLPAKADPPPLAPT